MQHQIEIKGLSKRFGEIQAVKDLNLTVFKNDVYGFLGPNGSGKSTTIRMMLTLIKSDKGEITFFNKPLLKNRSSLLSKIGAFIEKADFYEYLSAKKNLELLAAYSKIKPDRNRIDKVLELVGLQQRAKSQVKTFSKGMKQRLGIAQALLHDPEILILDEPASGLDPSGMRDIRNLITYLNEEENKTIILSSHNLQEIEQIANRMIIIDKGEKIVEGSVRELLHERSYFTLFEVDQQEKAKHLLKKSELEISKIETGKDGLKVYCQRNHLAMINKYLIENNIRVSNVVTHNSLEDYFLTLT